MEDKHAAVYMKPPPWPPRRTPDTGAATLNRDSTTGRKAGASVPTESGTKILKTRGSVTA